MSKVVKAVSRVPKKNRFGSHESLLRSSGWLAAKPSAEPGSGEADAQSRSTPSLTYLAMLHYFRCKNHLGFNADSVLQSVSQFVKDGGEPPSVSRAITGAAAVRKEANVAGGASYARLLYQDVNLKQYLSTVQPPRKNFTGLRPGRVVVHHYPQKTAVHVFTPDEVAPQTLKQVASVLSAASNCSVVLRAVKMQSIHQSASLIAQDICLQLEQRKQFRSITQALFRQLKREPYVEGIRVICSGRINGALIARSDRRGFGPLTLQSFSAKVDYAQAQAQLPYGILGIKVWVSYV